MCPRLSCRKLCARSRRVYSVDIDPLRVLKYFITILFRSSSVNITEMSDDASLYSTTATLVDETGARLPLDDASARAQPISPEDCFAALVIAHGSFKVDTSLLRRAGLTASYELSDVPGVPRSGLGSLNRRRKLHIQFPTSVMLLEEVKTMEDPQTAKQVEKRRRDRGSTHGKRMSLMSMLVDDIKAVRIRVITSSVLTLLFHCTDTQSPMLFFPASRVHRAPSWATQKGSNDYVSASVRWATLMIVAPDHAQDDELRRETKKEREAREKEHVKQIAAGDNDDEIAARLRQPISPAVSSLLDKVLLYLERRGAIWARAGQYCKPSTTNSDPNTRASFAVLGIFPEAFLDRCKKSNRESGLPPESDEAAKSPTAPLILSALCDRSSETRVDQFGHPEGGYWKAAQCNC